MKSKIKLFIFLAVSLVFFSSQTNTALAGFGISPPSLMNKNLVLGSSYQQIIYLVQNDPSMALHASVKIDTPKIDTWIKIENGNTFDIPKGVQQFPMKIDVVVPSDAPLGHYTGSIVVSTVPTTVNQGGVEVVLGGQINVALDVTSIQVSDFSIQNFNIPEVAKGSPIKFVIKVKNDGNIENGPTKASLTFFDQYHSKQLGQQEKDITEKVSSFQTKDITVVFPNNLDTGSYWADVKIYSSSNEVAVDSKIIFNVTSGTQVGVGNKQKPFAFFMPNLSAIPFWVYLLAGAVLVIVVLVVIIISILFKNKKHGGKNNDKKRK